MAEEKSVTEQLSDIVRPLFPREAMVQSTDLDGGCIISAAWRLGTHRMDNWSREIRVVIPRDVAERFGKLNQKGKVKAQGNLVSFVRLKLDSFKPEHDRPRYLLPPADLWQVSYNDIFPKA